MPLVEQPRSPWDSGLLARAVAFVACATYLFTTLFLAVVAVAIVFARGYTPVAVTSESMAPAIRRGDVMLVEQLEPTDIGVGHVVTFPRPGLDGLVSHRVADIVDRDLVTKGDANTLADSTPIDPGDVVGVGRVIVPFVGFPVLWLDETDWMGFGTWVLTLAGAFASIHQLSIGLTTPRRPDRDPDPEPAGAVRTTAVAGAATVVAVVAAFVMPGTSLSAAAFDDTTVNTADSFTAGWWFGIASITAGHDHSCVAKLDGSAWCWGENDGGQLGDGTTNDRTTPVQVVGPGGTGTLTEVVEISGGDRHTCARRADGTVWCWGRDDDGQLGNAGGGNTTTPIQVVGPGGSGTFAGAVSVAVGAVSTCAATGGGAAYCWGRNSAGQLGDGTTTNRQSPQAVVGVGGSGTLSGVTAVSTGYDSTCALVGDTPHCWGYNATGQLGDGTTTNRTNPVVVLGPGGTGTLGSVSLLDGGYDHRCALRSDGTVWCWGANGAGQLGDNTTSTRVSPVQVVGVGGSGTLAGVVDIGVGYDTSCAVASAGSAYCWGRNADGQIGDGTTTNRRTPVQVLGSGGTGTLTGSIEIAVGGYFSARAHTCAALVDEEAWCWGSNNSGQLGDTTTTDRRTPVQAGL